MNASPLALPSPAVALRERYLQLRREAHLHARDAARRLGVTEAEIVACMVGRTAVRLIPSFPQIMGNVERLGRVMALTRNEHVVHEKNGVYLNMQQQGQVGMALGPEIDLRIFYRHWAYGFAVAEPAQSDGNDAWEIRYSLQFFDAYGDAVHKIHLRPYSLVDAYHALVAEFKAADQTDEIAVEPLPAAAVPRDDTDVDIAGMQQAWRDMTDTHQFSGLLKKFGMQRHQALRLIGTEFAVQVAPDSAHALLALVAAEATPIMVFVASRGMIQIHGGPVRNVRKMGHWLNVLDSEFNLHLREDRIASAWFVRKPTADGIVTSLELFDSAHESLAMFFGQRKPGQPELPAWRAAVAQLAGSAGPVMP